LAAGTLASFAPVTLLTAKAGDEGAMYGLIGKIMAVPGQRDSLAQVLLEGSHAMPGCLSYVVALDPTDSNAIWVTEVWESQGSHQASVKLPAVQSAIAKGRSMIAGFGDRVVTQPVGGHGLRMSGQV
jgi:quinol monooxygenase YgiN